MKIRYASIRVGGDTYKVETVYSAEPKYGEGRGVGGMIDNKRVTEELCAKCEGVGCVNISVGPLPLAVDIEGDCKDCLGTGHKLVDLE